MIVGADRRAVAIGGGTGLPQVLRCLVDLGFETTAIVTMADDGGSSGVLRRQLGMLPPGDVRNCLVALAAEEDAILSQVFQYRFSGGEGLAGHALGNLIIAALADITGDFSEAVDVAGRYLEVRGRVLPSTLVDVCLRGIDRAGAEVFGQARLARSLEPVEKVFLDPERPEAFPPALEAIHAADVVVVGPGSLYTSIIPNFLVDGVARALQTSTARRVHLCNVANLRGETAGLDAADQVDALLSHGLEGALDLVVVHEPTSDSLVMCDDGHRVEVVRADAVVRSRIEGRGISVVARDLVDLANPVRHERTALRRVLEEVCA
jgi:uncharacterized cofD-like protein